MRKFLIAAAVATSAVAAVPASAQYYPAPQGYGYGYNNNQQGLVRSYLVRADQLRQRIERMDSRDRISEREARRLRNAAIDLQRRTRAYASNGLSWRERQELDRRFAQLQQALRYERNDGNNRRGGWDDRRGYDNGDLARRNGWTDRDGDGVWDHEDRFVDHDRDGRDDRVERRRGW